MSYFSNIHIALYKPFHFILPNGFQIEASETRTKLMWVHLFYRPLFFSKSFSYKNAILLHEAYLYYSRFLLPFTTMPQGFISIFYLSCEFFTILVYHFKSNAYVYVIRVVLSYWYFRKKLFTKYFQHAMSDSFLDNILCQIIFLCYMA